MLADIQKYCKCRKSKTSGQYFIRQKKSGVKFEKIMPKFSYKPAMFKKYFRSKYQAFEILISNTCIK
jgi:hypothetical protein